MIDVRSLKPIWLFVTGALISYPAGIYKLRFGLFM